MENQASLSILKNMGIRIGRRALTWRKKLWKSEVRGDEDKLDSLMISSSATCIKMKAGKRQPRRWVNLFTKSQCKLHH